MNQDLWICLVLGRFKEKFGLITNFLVTKAINCWKLAYKIIKWIILINKQKILKNFKTHLQNIMIKLITNIIWTHKWDFFSDLNWVCFFFKTKFIQLILKLDKLFFTISWWFYFSILYQISDLWFFILSCGIIWINFF